MGRISKVEEYGEQIKEIISGHFPDAEFQGPYKGRNLGSGLNEGIWYLEVRSDDIESAYVVMDLVRHITTNATRDDVPISLSITRKSESRTNAYQLI